MIKELLAYTVGILFYCPINIFIHEVGHAFFIKMFGGKMKRIQVGYGSPAFEFGKIVVNKYFFIFGAAEFDERTLKIKNKLSAFFIYFGGVLFNIIFLVLAIIAFNTHDPGSIYKGYYIGFTVTLIISALIPMTYPDGSFSDGKHIFKIFKSE